MAESRSRIARVMAVTETTYGVSETFTPADDGFLVYDNGSFIAVDTNEIVINPLSGVFTPRKSIIGRQLQTLNPKTFLQGPGTVATVPRIDALLRASAMTVASDASSVWYTPVSSPLSSAQVRAELDGIGYWVTGVYGNVTMSGSAGQGVEVNFDHRGLYQAPADVGSVFSGFSAGANRAAAMKSAQLSIGAWAYNDTTDPIVFKSFTFDRGVTVGERSDANAADALAGISIEDAQPTLELVVEAKDKLSGDVPDLYNIIQTATTQAISFLVGSGTGNVWTFSFPQAQLTNIAVADGEGNVRTWTLSFRITHTSDDAEFTLTLT